MIYTPSIHGRFIAYKMGGDPITTYPSPGMITPRNTLENSHFGSHSHGGRWLEDDVPFELGDILGFQPFIVTGVKEARSLPFF